MTRDELLDIRAEWNPDTQRWDRLRAVLRKSGLALVPIEPTEAMLSADVMLSEMECDVDTKYGPGVSDKSWKRAEWQAMLKAAEEG